MHVPDTKAAIVEMAREGYANFDAVLAGLGASRLTEPGLPGEWTVRDVVAHVSFWQCRLLRILDGETLAFALPGEDYETALNRINDEVYRQSMNMPASEVLSAYTASRDRVLATLQELSEESLLKHLDPICWNTWEHCEEHAAAIRQWSGSS